MSTLLGRCLYRSFLAMYTMPRMMILKHSSGKSFVEDHGKILPGSYKLETAIGNIKIPPNPISASVVHLPS